MEQQSDCMAPMTDRRARANIFLRAAGWGDATQTVLAGDASNRRYDRLRFEDGRSSVLMDAPPCRGEDIRPFVKLARYLTDLGFSAPQFFHQDEAEGFLLIEDLGDAVFAKVMAQDPAMTIPLYKAATDVLVCLHRCDPPDVPLCSIHWLVTMTAPAFEWYARDTGSIAAFEAAFRPLAASLEPENKVLILRDYHAENLLWLPERDGVAKVGLLDFQDALVGHPAYDLVSVLQDARRDVSPEIEAQMIAHYIAESQVDSAEFRAAYALLGLQRNLRILGIFARLCLRDGKTHYVDLIPRVWGYVQRNLETPHLAALRTFLDDALPKPTPEFLEQLKARCATIPQPL